MLSSTVARATQEKDVLEVRIEALLEAGVPIRTLIGHQLCSIDCLLLESTTSSGFAITASAVK